MITIHKKILDVKDEQLVMLPMGAEILSAGNQHNLLVIWYKCNTLNDNISRKIYIRGTGHEMNGAERQFINTVQMFNGDLVWHVFEG